MLIKQSILTTSVMIAALGMSATAVATSNPYSSYSSDDFFSGKDAAFVVGVQGGYADTHWSNLENFIVPDSSVNDTGFAARGFLGYDINRYFGLEAGYTYLPTTTVDGFSGDISSYAIDLLAKLSVPVTNVFSLYAKAGGSYLNASSNDLAGISSETNTHIGPAFGVGAAYEVVPNLAIDLSWMRFSGQGQLINSDGNSDYIPNPDVVLLGISYKFPVNFS